MNMTIHFWKWYFCLLLLVLGRQVEAQEGWKIYEYPVASCALSFPAMPSTAQEDNVWTAQAKSDNVVYQAVVYFNEDYNPSNAEAVIKESVEGFINPTTDKIIQTERVQMQGLPAQKIQVQSQDGTALVFCTWVGKGKLYQMAIIGNDIASTLRKAQQFLDSFKQK